MITGRWELKITNYGLDNLKNSQKVDDISLYIKNTENEQAKVVGSVDDLLWLAPESVVATPHNVYLTFPSQQADVYSAGIIINQILTRERPYSNLKASPHSIFNQVCEDELRPKMRPLGQDDFTSGMNAIIHDCLETDCFQRPSFDTLGVKYYYINHDKSILLIFVMHRLK
jgi:serine/threonine protein kinase